MPAPPRRRCFSCTCVCGFVDGFVRHLLGDGGMGNGQRAIMFYEV